MTGAHRTANVVADEPVTLLQVSAVGLRQLMSVPAFSQLTMEKMNERLNRSSTTELPRFAELDQQALLDLRTAQPVEDVS